MRMSFGGHSGSQFPTTLLKSAGCFLLLVAAACGVQSSPPVAPENLETVDQPPDLAQLDIAVREQFDEYWQAVQGQSAGADRGASWGRMGQWFDVYHYPDSAARCYRNARRLNPQEPRWPYYLGRVEEQAGDLEAAEEQYRAAAALAPAALAPRVRLGDVALQRQDLDRAEGLYRQVLDTEPAQPGALLGLAQVALQRGNPQAALEPLEALARSQPEAVQVQYSLSLAWRQLGDDEKAAGYLQNVPEDNLDQISLDMGDPWERELLQMDRGARTLTRRGVRAFRRGEEDQAAVLLGRAVTADPEGPEKRINYALALRETGHWQGAREELEAALQLAEEGTELAAKAHLEMGRLLSAQGRPAEAVPHFEATLAIDPRSIPAHVEMGRLLHRRGDLEGALDHYAALRALEHPVAGTRFWHAALLIALHRDAEALATLNEDLAQLPDDRPLRLLLARLLSASPAAAVRDLPRARRLLEVDAEPADRSPPDVLYAETAAMVAAAEGRFGEASAWQRAAVEAVDGMRPRTAAHTARRRLVLYQRGEACHAPWEARETQIVKPVQAPEMRRETAG